ncbi:MAG: pyrF [Rickettsiaceae bacterium]|jgi:orotidine-5'-phosphate decarboxylase|nr:pyrF [Rickettsiaceae bacterium]
MIENRDRLIVALDVPDIESAKNLVEKLGDEVSFYKIGLELMMSGDYFKMIDWLAKKDKKVFADLKLYDIPATVGRAVKNLSGYANIHFLTIHCASKSIMEMAAQNKGKINILGVTVLTSLDQNDLVEMGFDKDISLENLVIKKASLAKECGINGVVASALEAKIIRQNLGQNFRIISPGIRLENSKSDDQKRVADVKTAFANGVDHIVVGRPITESQNPKQSAQEFQNQIAKFSDY